VSGPSFTDSPPYGNEATSHGLSASLTARLAALTANGYDLAIGGIATAEVAATRARATNVFNHSQFGSDCKLPAWGKLACTFLEEMP
jgi:hypothetical protein